MKGPSTTVLFGLCFLTSFIAFHRPVPYNFTDSLFERIVMFFLELIMRFSYIYPSRLLFNNPFDQVNYTREISNFLLSFIQPPATDPDMVIEDTVFDSVRVRVYIPHNRSNSGAIVFLHGGAFVVGNVQMFEAVTRKLSKNTKMTTISVDYRLAPEHVFPAGLDDCERVVVYLMKYAYKTYNVNPYRVVIMGDSAGGGLAASLTQRLRNRHDIPQPKAQVMVYPLVQLHDLRISSYEYYYQEMDGTSFLEPAVLAQYYLMYAGIDLNMHPKLVDIVLNNGHISPLDREIVEQYLDFEKLPKQYRLKKNRTRWEYNDDYSRLIAPYLFNPEFAPLMQPDLSNLPKALVFTCEHDILRDEGIIYAFRLKEAGVETTWKHFSTCFHGLLNFYPTINTATRALDVISNWISENA